MPFFPSGFLTAMAWASDLDLVNELKLALDFKLEADIEESSCH